MAEGAGNGVVARGLTRSGPATTARAGAPIRLAVAVVFGLAIVSVLSFSKPGGARVLTPISVRTAVLSADGTDTYALETANSSVRAIAPVSNTGGNLRTVFWPSDAPAQPDELTCATWTGAASDRTQQGAALRVSTSPTGSVRALTVTKNVYLDPTGVFNVHIWNEATNTIEWITNVDLRPTFSQPALPGVTPSARPLPWRLCARVAAMTLEFKAWRTEESEPAWGDPAHGATVQLPEDAPRVGYTGWYVGHLEPGTAASFTELESAPYVPAR